MNYEGPYTAFANYGYGYGQFTPQAQPMLAPFIIYSIPIGILGASLGYLISESKVGAIAGGLIGAIGSYIYIER